MERYYFIVFAVHPLRKVQPGATCALQSHWPTLPAASHVSDGGHAFHRHGCGWQHEVADDMSPPQIAVLFTAARSAVKQNRMADIELFTVPGSHIGFGASLQECSYCAGESLCHKNCSNAMPSHRLRSEHLLTCW